MFHSCKEIIEMNLTHFNTSKVSNMLSMFDGCTNLKYLDVSNIDTSKVRDMGRMFFGCSSLISLDLSNFDTSNNTNIGTMFQGCSSLKYVDLSSFNTSKINYFDNLFNGCKSLTSIDLSSFNTSKVTHMNNMFRDCESLTSINISNFNTKEVENFNNIFDGCKSLLVYLDFQDMDLSSADNIGNMFDKCNNLIYVNIKNYKINYNNRNYDFFKNSPSNIAVCTENEELKEKIKLYKGCSFIGCSDNWYELMNKITEKGECVQNCTSTNYKYEYNFKCISNCLSGTYINNYKCEKCHEDCEKCSGPKTISSTNCISCSSKDKYLYFGNCVDECPGNSYYHNYTIAQNICDYELVQCKTFSKESLKKNYVLFVMMIKVIIQ